MSEFRTASRYASALLGLAKEKGVLEKVHTDMLQFISVCDQNPTFRMMLKNPIINHEKKYAVMKALFAKSADNITMSFYDIIRKKKREKFLPEIAKAFHHQYNSLLGITQVMLGTAIKLTDKQQAVISKLAEGYSKGKIELKEKVNPELIGGFVLTIGDKQLDESVKRKFVQIKTSFSNN